MDALQLLRGSRRCMCRDGAIAERASGKVKRKTEEDVARSITTIRNYRAESMGLPRFFRPKSSGDRRAGFTSIFARFALLVSCTLNDYITVTPITKPHTVSNILKDLINR